MDILQKNSVDKAFEYCAKITRDHYENFPVASLLIPYEKRPYIQSIYAFARLADDFADESNLSPIERIKLLDDWEEQLKMCYKGEAQHPVFIALSETVSKLSIPIEPLANLIYAFKMDVQKNRYKSSEELLTYCKHSANPVGRLVLMIFGYKDDKLFHLSDCICTALQLTNFAQDVSVDLLKNRVYLPEDEIISYGYSYEELFAKVYNQNFIKLMQFQIERARQLFYKGAELINLVDKDLQLELRLVWFGGMSVLNKIIKKKYNVFEDNVKLSLGNKIMIFLRGLFYNNVSLYKKKSLWDLN
ncbi:MAG: Phytoene synthase [Ignavibacteriae bacterium]|nr:MAG: Phytoene synthase [Ignavibacteriota bacterium]